MIWKQDFEILKEAPKTAALHPIFTSEDTCGFRLPVFANLDDQNDEITNDFSSFITFFSSVVTSATAVLIKNGSEEIPISSVGQDFSLGFFQNTLNQKPFGVRIDWFAVLAGFGSGCYQIRVRGVFGTTNIDRFSFKYNLQPFDEERADNTVRFHYFLNGFVGDPENEQNRRDFQRVNWENQLRVPFSIFGKDNSDVENEFVRYQTGVKFPTTQIRKTKYVLNIGRIWFELHRFIQFDVLMGDNLTITDYNLNNSAIHIETPVTGAGEYSPNYNTLDKLAAVEVEFESAFDNHYKLRT